MFTPFSKNRKSQSSSRKALRSDSADKSVKPFGSESQKPAFGKKAPSKKFPKR